jgi:hypothetical protein
VVVAPEDVFMGIKALPIATIMLMKQLERCLARFTKIIYYLLGVNNIILVHNDCCPRTDYLIVTYYF